MPEDEKRQADRELLEQYVSGGSREAFAELVERYTETVYSTCLRVLGDAHAAEDATQAVFLLLLNKAPKIRREAALAGWLHRSAEYTARNARRMLVRRARHEREAAAMKKKTETAPPAEWNELRPRLDAALEALPGRQRDAIVLRYFQHKSEGEIARELGCPRSTVSTRLSSGLAKLRARLSRLGVALPAAALASLLGAHAAEAAPAGLAMSVQAACFGKAAASATALAIKEATMKAMLMAKVKLAAALLVTATVAGVAAPLAVKAAVGGGGGAKEPKGAPSAGAKDAVRPGKLIEEPPTLTCLGVRWLVSGDADRDAKVTVHYRAKGATDWREGLPLLRVDTRVAYGRKVPGMFAGTIFDLQPGRAYEVKLTLSDPGGGGTGKRLTMRTRPVPCDAADARIVKCEAARLQEAFNQAAPGDVLLVSAGTFQGTLNVRSRKGTAQRPIVIRAAAREKVILDGGGAADVVNARNAEYIFLEGLLIRNAKGAGVNCEAAKGLVVRRCRIEQVKQGIYNADPRRPGKDFYIADNVILGPYRWPETGIKDAEGIQVCGTGHVICYNRIRGWSDGAGIVDQRGKPYPAAAIDFYNNDISECTDDAIEMDTGQHNVRAFRNRITDCFAGISEQPIYGGPCYVVRNVFYNIVNMSFKMANKTSGLIIFHNTSVRTGKVKAALLHYDDAPVRNAVFRNNLFLGNGGRAIESWGNFIGCDLDYNGYTAGPCAYTKDGKTYKKDSFPVFVKASGLERHGVLVTPAVFAQNVPFPKNKERHAPLDLRLREKSPAVDAGVRLPGINDGFAGKAPDLGAYEVGQPRPHYGPRPAVKATAAGEAPKEKAKASAPPTPFPFVMHTRLLPTKPLPKPQKSVPFTDPAFGTRIVRVTDCLAEAKPHKMMSPEYPTFSHENCDGTFFLAMGQHPGGRFHLYDAASLKLLKPLEVRGDVSPRWDASDPNILYLYCNRFSFSWSEK